MIILISAHFVLGAVNLVFTLSSSLKDSIRNRPRSHGVDPVCAGCEIAKSRGIGMDGGK